MLDRPRSYTEIKNINLWDNQRILSWRIVSLQEKKIIWDQITQSISNYLKNNSQLWKTFRHLGRREPLRWIKSSKTITHHLLFRSSMECIRQISIETLKEGIWWGANLSTISLRTARGCLGDSQTGIIKTTNSPCQHLKTILVDTITHSLNSNTSLKLLMKITVPTKEWILYSIMRDTKRGMTYRSLISRKI